MASNGSCVTNKTEIFDFCNRCKVSSLTSSFKFKSKLEKGSSNNYKSGFAMMERAKATRCCSPPLNS